jgi:hypothetical protein
MLLVRSIFIYIMSELPLPSNGVSLFFIFSAYSLTFQVHDWVDEFWSNNGEYLKSKCDYHCCFLLYMLGFVDRDSFLGYIYFDYIHESIDCDAYKIKFKKLWIFKFKFKECSTNKKKEKSNWTLIKVNSFILN